MGACGCDPLGLADCSGNVCVQLELSFPSAPGLMARQNAESALTSCEMRVSTGTLRAHLESGTPPSRPHMFAVRAEERRDLVCVLLCVCVCLCVSVPLDSSLRSINHEATTCYIKHALAAIGPSHVRLPTQN